MSNVLPCFEGFLEDLRLIWDTHDDDASRMSVASVKLRELIANEDLFAHSRMWPDTVMQNLLLYEDEQHGFVVNAVVRPPGYTGGVHDHANAWVLYGVLDGTETLERYRRLDSGETPGYAKVELISATPGERGSVDIVPPFDIHAEQGGGGRSVALIVRSQRLVGKVLQNGYKPADNSVVQRWGPEQVPYALTV
jgi:predicted metal-dependent enzyme (double-stranded beta helix superfamily)